MIHIKGPTTKSKITNVQPKDIQPNAVDLRLERVLAILPNTFVISEDHKSVCGTVELEPNEEGYFILRKGSYEVVMENEVEVAEGEAGWVHIRSTLLRNGNFLFSGIFDGGFKGKVGGVLQVTAPEAHIKKGTRIAQFIVFKAETLHAYDGTYGLDANGNPKTAEQVYFNK
jgi:deoxycytidine triphosphate deaminase